MKKYSKYILRVHGSFAIMAGTVLTIIGWIGTFQGKGSFSVLETQPIGYIGLFQAYLLMACFGIVLWIASYRQETRVWHIAGFLAHSPPLAANLIFWDMITEYGISHSGIFLHIVFMLIESVAFIFYNQNK